MRLRSRIASRSSSSMSAILATVTMVMIFIINAVATNQTPSNGAKFRETLARLKSTEGGHQGSTSHDSEELFGEDSSQSQSQHEQQKESVRKVNDWNLLASPSQDAFEGSGESFGDIDDDTATSSSSGSISSSSTAAIDSSSISSTTGTLGSTGVVGSTGSIPLPSNPSSSSLTAGNNRTSASGSSLISTHDSTSSSSNGNIVTSPAFIAGMSVLGAAAASGIVVWVVWLKKLTPVANGARVGAAASSASRQLTISTIPNGSIPNRSSVAVAMGGTATTKTNTKSLGYTFVTM